MATPIVLNVNGHMAQVTVDDPNMPLLYALRNDLGLRGPRFGCGLGQRGKSEVHARVPAAETDQRGSRLFAQACTGCHLLNGEGRQSPWASLRGDHSIRDSSGANVVQVLSHGSQIDAGQGPIFMHSFIGGYSDDELAALGSFVIGQIGLRQCRITPEQFRAQRASATNDSRSAR